MSGYVYLAQPYSSEHPQVMEARFEAGQAFCASRFGERVVYSPIAHWHPIAQRHDLPTDFEPWQESDFAMIAAAEELWVFMLDGWRSSQGVAREIEYARSLGKPIRYFEREGNEQSEERIEVEIEEAR